MTVIWVEYHVECYDIGSLQVSLEQLRLVALEHSPEYANACPKPYNNSVQLRQCHQYCAWAWVSKTRLQTHKNRPRHNDNAFADLLRGETSAKTRDATERDGWPEVRGEPSECACWVVLKVSQRRNLWSRGVRRLGVGYAASLNAQQNSARTLTP